MKIKEIIEEYQCSGCVCGSDTSCYTQSEDSLECTKHVVGTTILGVGNILLGMPKGFNRVGATSVLNLKIYNSYKESTWQYDKWNIPTWKYLDEYNHTIVRGHMPRINQTFIHIFLENCLDKIDCLEITKEDVEGMD